MKTVPSGESPIRVRGKSTASPTTSLSHVGCCPVKQTIVWDCVFITAVPITKLLARREEDSGPEDMCYERRRAEASVDNSAHHDSHHALGLVNAPGVTVCVYSAVSCVCFTAYYNRDFEDGAGWCACVFIIIIGVCASVSSYYRACSTYRVVVTVSSYYCST